jgi:hypothetical protein
MLAATWGFVSRILAPLIRSRIFFLQYSEVLVASDSAKLMLAPDLLHISALARTHLGSTTAKSGDGFWPPTDTPSTLPDAKPD